MPIVPDEKNWTWVLERPCPECGFDTREVTSASIAPRILESAGSWFGLLTGADASELRRRPSESIWSPLEYGCHVRDVFRLFDQRLHLMLDADNPTFANWDQDATAIAERYVDEDPVRVASELAEAAEVLARSFAGVQSEAWERRANRSDGARFNVETFGRYLIHDPVHHLHDVGAEPEASDITTVTIAVIGDFSGTNETHVATNAALGHAGTAAGARVAVTWVATDELASGGQSLLSGFDGLVIAPGSPYRSMEAALMAIGLARREDIPLLGTCGGFQHVVIEFARNVAGVADADHAEYRPDAANLFVTPLLCSLVGQQMEVGLVAGTRAADAYQALSASERYYCNFGLNPDRVGQLVEAGMVVSGTDRDGEVRIVELPELAFFVATLFVPQTSSRIGAPHPLVARFVESAAFAARSPRSQ